jgi:hypothetical protein
MVESPQVRIKHEYTTARNGDRDMRIRSLALPLFSVFFLVGATGALGQSAKTPCNVPDVLCTYSVLLQGLEDEGSSDGLTFFAQQFITRGADVTGDDFIAAWFEENDEYVDYASEIASFESTDDPDSPITSERVRWFSYLGAEPYTYTATNGAGTKQIEITAASPLLNTFFIESNDGATGYVITSFNVDDKFGDFLEDVLNDDGAIVSRPDGFRILSDWEGYEPITFGLSKP